jgi:hypothetical protein
MKTVQQQGLENKTAAALTRQVSRMDNSSLIAVFGFGVNKRKKISANTSLEVCTARPRSLDKEGGSQCDDALPSPDKTTKEAR